MKKRFDIEAIVNRIIRFRYPLITLITVATLLSAWAISRGLQIDNSLAIWFLEDDETYREYQQFQRDYGSDEIVIAAVPVSYEQLPEQIDVLNALTQDLERLTGVQSVFSIAQARYPIPVGAGLRWVPFYDAQRQDAQQRRLFTELEDYRAQLLSEDLEYAFLYTQLSSSDQIEAERSALIAAIEQTIKQYYEGAYITGPPVLNEAYNKALQKEAGIFGLLTLLVIAIVLIILLPNRRFAFIAALAVVLPTLFLFGLIAAFGVKLNMISALIPTLLLVYALSDVVHILNAFNQELGRMPNAPSVSVLLTRAIQKSIVPCALTTATTIVGYFALYFSALPALKSMGLWASLGILVAFVMAYLVIVLGISFWSVDALKSPDKRRSGLRESRVSDWIITLVKLRGKEVLGVSLVFLVLAAVFALKVKVTTDSLSLLPDSPAKKALYEVEYLLGSSSRLQLNLTLRDSETFSYQEFLEDLSDFHLQLSTYPELGNVFSIHSVRGFLEKRYSTASFAQTASEKTLKNALKNASPSDKSVFNLVSPDLNTFVITVGFSQMPTHELSALFAKIERDFNAQFGEEVALEIDGFATVFATLNAFVVSSQLTTFGLAFLVILLLLTWYLKNFRRALLVLLPNLMPLFGLFALMYVFDISLGVTTAMITPIILGIAMDDTLHLLYHFLRPDASMSTQPLQPRLEGAIRYATPALLTSTIALIAGFFIIALSNTPAVSEFGLLCLVAIAIALLADLTFLPALIRRYW